MQLLLSELIFEILSPFLRIYNFRVKEDETYNKMIKAADVEAGTEELPALVVTAKIKNISENNLKENLAENSVEPRVEIMSNVKMMRALNEVKKSMMLKGMSGWGNIVRLTSEIKTAPSTIKHRLMPTVASLADSPLFKMSFLFLSQLLHSVYD